MTMAMTRTTKRKTWSIAGIALILLFLLSGCGGTAAEEREEAHSEAGHEEISETFETTASVNVLPSFLDSFTPTTQELYAKADLHADIISHLNCYCGCMDYNDPHDSLYRCFIMGKSAESVEWTDHGAKCGICMMEVRDAAKMAEEGKSLDEIKAFIDSTYGGGGV